MTLFLLTFADQSAKICVLSGRTEKTLRDQNSEKEQKQNTD